MCRYINIVFKGDKGRQNKTVYLNVSYVPKD